MYRAIQSLTSETFVRLQGGPVCSVMSIVVRGVNGYRYASARRLCRRGGRAATERSERTSAGARALLVARSLARETETETLSRSRLGARELRATGGSISE